MHNPKIITEFLEKLGFDSEAINIYLTLVKNGKLTLLEVSRKSSIERTKLYRRVEELINKGLIEEVPEYKRRTIKAVDLNSIDLLIKQKQLETKYLSDSIPAFSEAINLLSGSVPGNNVVYYRGVEGIKQLTWHILRCNGLFRTYSYRFWNDLFGDNFTLEFNKELVSRKFLVHDIYSEGYIRYKNEWLKSGHKWPDGDWHFWESRYISEKIIKVNQNIDIYNDTVAYYYWQDDELFGVEIQNQRIADMHKQIHDVLWKMAKKRPEINWQKKEK